MSLVPPLKVANLGTISFTVNSFLLYLRLTVKIFQFLRLSTKFLAVLRLSVNPIETLMKAKILLGGGVGVLNKFLYGGDSAPLNPFLSEKLDQFRFPGNCPPTPPLSHHFALSER